MVMEGDEYYKTPNKEWLQLGIRLTIQTLKQTVKGKSDKILEMPDSIYQACLNSCEAAEIVQDLVKS